MREIKVKGMKVLVGKDYQEMSDIAKQLTLSQMMTTKRVNMAITAGRSPKLMYDLMIPDVKGNFENVHYFNFDEIPYRGKEGYGVTMTLLKSMYLDPAGIEQERIHWFNQDNYKHYDDYLESIGGLDYLVMGVGGDGHFCGNLPGTTTMSDWASRVNCDISEKMMKIMEQEVQGKDLIPEFYVTLGPKSVMQTKKLCIIASGKEKADVCKALTSGKIDSNLPVTIFQLHTDLVLILDEDAASLIE